MRLLIVEDDPALGEGICNGLRQEGYTIDWLQDGMSALHALQQETFDLVVLDLGLPRLDGIEVLRRLRAGGDAVPVLILTARDATDDRIAGLDVGADDYLVKPFGVPELLARIRAQLRRHGQSGTAAATSKVAFGAIEVDLATHEVRREGLPVHLTPIEYRLLCALIRGQSRVLTHRQLLLEVWGLDYVDRAHYLRVHMAHLRQKLEADPAQPQHLITELQVGYRLVGL